MQVTVVPKQGAGYGFDVPVEGSVIGMRRGRIVGGMPLHGQENMLFGDCREIVQTVVPKETAIDRVRQDVRREELFPGESFDAAGSEVEYGRCVAPLVECTGHKQFVGAAAAPADRMPQLQGRIQYGDVAPSDVQSIDRSAVVLHHLDSGEIGRVGILIDSDFDAFAAYFYGFYWNGFITPHSGENPN